MGEVGRGGREVDERHEVKMQAHTRGPALFCSVYALLCSALLALPDFYAGH